MKCQNEQLKCENCFEQEKDLVKKEAPAEAEAVVFLHTN